MAEAAVRQEEAVGAGPPEAERKPGLSVEVFLAAGEDLDARHELVGGEVVATAPASARHNRIQANAVVAMERRLAGRRPRATFPEAGIRVSEQDFFVADVAVSCRGPDERPWVEEPLLLVEIVSPGSRAHDLGTKLPAYKELTSVREIWLVDSTRRWVEQWVRTAEGWVGRDVAGGGSLDSPVLEARVELDELYEGSGLEAA